MGTHPIFESDFDCLTEMDRDKEAELKSYMERLPPPTQEELEALGPYSSTTGMAVGFIGGAGLGMIMISKIKSRAVGYLGAFTQCVIGTTVGQTYGTKRNFQEAMESGQFNANFPAGGLKECLKASITGVPPDPEVMERYLQPTSIQQPNRLQYQQGIQFQPPPTPTQTSEVAPAPPVEPPAGLTEKKYNKYGDEIYDD